MQKVRHAASGVRVHAKAHGPPLTGQRQKILDRHGQTRIDSECLRHIADPALAAPVGDDAALEGHLAEQRAQQRRLARAVWTDDHVDAPPLDGERDGREQLLAVATDRDLDELEERRLTDVPAHVSATSARIIVSTLVCISRSKRSGVNGPDAMWLMV